MEAVVPARSQLLRRGLMLEYTTLGWNVVGVGVLAIAAIAAGSVGGLREASHGWAEAG